MTRLKIENPETLQLARELAALTGESMSAAITHAIRERLGRVRRERRGAVSERLLAIGRETAPLFKEPYRTADHADLLYDDVGLSR